MDWKERGMSDDDGLEQKERSEGGLGTERNKWR
jgi:hypothetical protein